MKTSIINPTDAAIRTRSDTLAFSSVSKVDWRNIALLLAAYVPLAILIPPVRFFAMDDDWAYIQSVQRLLAGTFRPHEWAQPTSIGAVGWGGLLSSVFGFSLTLLTIQTLVTSALCLALLYVLLRHLNVGSAGALLGAALLGLNPIYIYLSFSYMTDVAFLAYVLGSLVCFVRWFQGRRGGDAWLWAGSILASLAYLTRQLGILAVVVALFYLYWSRKWSWGRAIAIAAVPILAAVGYQVWAQMQPSQLVSLSVADMKTSILQHPMQYALDHAQGLAWSISLPGLFILPLVRLPRRPLLALPLLVFFVVFQLKSILQVGTVFPEDGNVIDHRGYVMYDYRMDPLFPQAVWALLGIIGALCLSLLFAVCVERAWDWLRSQPWKTREGGPELMVYLLGAALAVITLVVSPFIFDRYFVPIVPFLALVVLRERAPEAGSAGNQRPRTGLRWLVLAAIGLFALGGMRDYMEHARVRWQGAEQLVARGADPVRISAGYEWSGMYLYGKYTDYIRATKDRVSVPTPPEGPRNPDYIVSDLPVDGYAEIDRLPYTSWVAGGVTRYVRLLERTPSGK